MNKGPPERRNSSGMSQQPSDGPGSGQACVCLITCLLFLLLLAGGVFLVMFISLPSSSAPSWLLPVGMILVASPWIFWIFTCLYRCIALRIAYANRIRAEDRPSSQRQATRQPTLVVARDAPQQQVVEEEALESPGGARKVRFGNATVLGTISDDGDEETAGGSHTGPAGIAEGKGVSRDTGESSTASRESEKPLTLSMSS